MRKIVLSALFAIGVGLTGVSGAVAAPISGLNTDAAATTTLLGEVQYRYRHRTRCRSVTVCRRGPYGRRCHVERVCRRW
jgi:hypothetical protein